MLKNRKYCNAKQRRDSTRTAMRIIQSLQNRASCAVPLQRRGKDQFRYDEHAQDFEPEDQERFHDHTAISAVVTIRRDFLDTQGPRRWVVVRGEERVQAVWPIRSIFALTRSEQSALSLLQTTSTLEIVSSQPAVGGTVLPGLRREIDAMDLRIARIATVRGRLITAAEMVIVAGAALTGFAAYPLRHC